MVALSVADGLRGGDARSTKLDFTPSDFSAVFAPPGRLIDQARDAS